MQENAFARDHFWAAIPRNENELRGVSKESLLMEEEEEERETTVSSHVKALCLRAICGGGGGGFASGSHPTHLQQKDRRMRGAKVQRIKFQARHFFPRSPFFVCLFV